MGASGTSTTNLVVFSSTSSDEELDIQHQNRVTKLSSVFDTKSELKESEIYKIKLSSEYRQLDSELQDMILKLYSPITEYNNEELNIILDRLKEEKSKLSRSIELYDLKYDNLTLGDFSATSFGSEYLSILSENKKYFENKEMLEFYDKILGKYY